VGLRYIVRQMAIMSAATRVAVTWLRTTVQSGKTLTAGYGVSAWRGLPGR